MQQLNTTASLPHETKPSVGRNARKAMTTALSTAQTTNYSLTLQALREDGKRQGHSADCKRKATQLHGGFTRTACMLTIVVRETLRSYILWPNDCIPARCGTRNSPRPPPPPHLRTTVHSANTPPRCHVPGVVLTEKIPQQEVIGVLSLHSRPCRQHQAMRMDLVL